MQNSKLDELVQCIKALKLSGQSMKLDLRDLEENNKLDELRMKRIKLNIFQTSLACDQVKILMAEMR